jgi:acetyl-CoA synthetase
MEWRIKLPQGSHNSACEEFSWEQIPDDFNIAADCLRKHEDPGRPALYQSYPSGEGYVYSFRDLDNRSNQLANALESLGLDRGDRVAIILPQTPENPLSHLACWKLGAISVPLSVLFGVEAIEHRLLDSGATAIVAHRSVIEEIKGMRDNCPELRHVIGVGLNGDEDGMIDFDDVCEGESAERDIVATDVSTPACIMYTSGSTGPPKGVLHTHGVWLGHCPGFYMYFERDVDDSVFWTPADWAWIGALGDLLFPAWHYGRPVVGYPMGSFDPTMAYRLLEEFEVTDAFIPPTAIRMMMSVDAPTERYDLGLNTICSGGEPLTSEILGWADESLEGVIVNELYGQTEANLLVANCRDWFSARPGSMGKPVPGHDVGIVDPDTGRELPVGEVGTIAVRRDGDPVVFREYWNDSVSSDSTRIEEWHLTGDLGYRGEDGYYWFKSRDDDLIITAGYRVGPGEVESTILEHPEVEQVGVVGVPDDTRGEIIKAYVQPIAGVEGDEQLAAEIRDRVRDQLALYEYPRAIEFVEELPQTTTGKIQRRKLRSLDRPE